MMRKLSLLAVSLVAASAVQAQRPDQLVRMTAATGGNDSGIVAACDSVRPICRVRGISFAELAKTVGGHVVPHATLADTVTLGGRDSLTLGTTKLRVGKRLIAVGNDTMIGQFNFKDTISCVSGCVIIGQPTWGSNQLITLATSAQPNITSLGTLISIAHGRDSLTTGNALVMTAPNDSLLGQPAFGTNLQHLKADSASLADSANVVRTLIDSLVTASTQPAKDSSRRVANTQYVDRAVAGGGASFPLKAPSGTAAAPSYQFNTASDTEGIYRVGKDTLGFSAAGILQLKLGFSDTSAIFTNKAKFSDGSTGVPSITFSSAGTTGIRRRSGGTNLTFVVNGADEAEFNTAGLRSVGSNAFDIGSSSEPFKRVFTDSLRGVANTSIIGGAGNMTIQAGTGNSRTLSLQSTTSAGAAKSNIVLNSDSSTTFLGNIRAMDATGSQGSDNPPIGWADSVGIWRVGTKRTSYGIRNSNGNTTALTVDGTVPNVSVSVNATGVGNFSATGLNLSGGMNFKPGANDTIDLSSTKFLLSNKSAAGNAVLQLEGLGTNADATVNLVPNSSNGTARLQVNAVSMVQMARGSTALDFSSNTLTHIGNGTASAPSVTFTNKTNTGVYFNGGDSISLASNGSQMFFCTQGGGVCQASVGQFNLNTASDARWVRNGANNVQLDAGSGQGTIVMSAARVSIQPNGTAAEPALSFAAKFSGDSTSGFYHTGNSTKDTINVSADGIKMLAVDSTNIRLPVVPATGSGDVQLCIKTTFEVTKGATCGSSTAAIKSNIAPLRDPVRDILALKPRQWDYQPGFYDGRHSEGFIAGDVAKVNPTFAFYSPTTDTLSNGAVVRKGEPFNVDEKAILAEAIATIQADHTTMDSLRVIIGQQAAMNARQDAELRLLHEQVNGQRDRMNDLEQRLDALSIAEIRRDQPCGASGHGCDPKSPTTKLTKVVHSPLN